MIAELAFAGEAKYDYYGPRICFVWDGHFILDLNSSIAKRLMVMDEFVY